MSGTRSEKDSFGAIDVPADRLWGAQTERSRRFFRISSERMPLPVVHALALVKRLGAIELDLRLYEGFGIIDELPEQIADAVVLAVRARITHPRLPFHWARFRPCRPNPP